MDQITNLLAIMLGAILANNFIFSQFLGICPFLGVSKKVDTAVGMGIAVTFVMGLASAVCYAVNQFVLVRFDLEYMQTVTFIRSSPPWCSLSRCSCRSPCPPCTPRWAYTCL